MVVVVLNLETAIKIPHKKKGNFYTEKWIEKIR